MDTALRPLTHADLNALLAFERKNRAYFEQWVPPRPAWFFTDNTRYISHMESLLQEQAEGAFQMYVLTSNAGQIIGRINLTISKSGIASLGYRIAQAQSGKGLATAAIKQICKLAPKAHGISSLSAQAARCNLASQQVLLNSGFAKTHAPAQQVSLNGQQIWLEPFHKPL
ncbi:MAG: GNAT family N-acetyltransferase [Rhodobacteraceae bacterium]|nr:GNAT family N-acetyltransferase [Paracoccaceae bacterium]